MLTFFRSKQPESAASKSESFVLQAVRSWDNLAWRIAERCLKQRKPFWRTLVLLLRPL